MKLEKQFSTFGKFTMTALVAVLCAVTTACVNDSPELLTGIKDGPKFELKRTQNTFYSMNRDGVDIGVAKLIKSERGELEFQVESSSYESLPVDSRITLTQGDTVVGVYVCVNCAHLVSRGAVPLLWVKHS